MKLHTEQVIQVTI